MAKRDIELTLREITEVRSRIYRHHWDMVDSDVHNRLTKIRTIIGSEDVELHRHVIVASIAALQTFHRGTIISIIDSGKIYRTRAAEVVQDKFSLKEALIWLTGDAVTFSEFIAHLAPCSSVTELVSWLGALLDCDLKQKLREAVNPLELRNRAPNPKSVVADVEGLLADLAEAFRLRHILAHEAAPYIKVTADDCRRAWNAIHSWTLAITAILWATIYTGLPLTQSEMNVEASDEVKSARSELAKQMRKALTHLRTSGAAHALRVNHFEWKRMTDDWIAINYSLDGTMWSAVRGGELANAIRSRVEQVRTLVGWQNPEVPEE